MAAGAVPVTIDQGAIKTTVGKGGVILSNTTSDGEYIKWVAALFKDKELRTGYLKKGRKIAKKHDWSKLADQWLDLLKRLEVKMVNTPRIICPECKQKMANDYVLKKHLSKKHGIKDKDVPAAAKASSIRKTTVLKFKQGVECTINGVHYSGSEIEVPLDSVPAVIDAVTNAYGDVLLA